MGLNVIPIISIIFWGGAVHRLLRINKAYIPFYGVTFVIAAQAIAGVLNVLYPAAWILLIGGPIIYIGLVLKDCVYGRDDLEIGKCIAAPLATLSTICFLMACIMMAIIYTIQPPTFTVWDEFSHWGMFYKAVYYYHRIPIYVDGFFFTHGVYPQAASSFYAYISLLQGQYAESDIFYTVNTLLFACASTLIVPLSEIYDRYRSRITKGIILFAAMVITIAVYTGINYNYAGSAYIHVYMDIPVGVLFGAILVYTFCATDTIGDMLAIGIACISLVYLKDVGFVFALVTAGYYCLVFFWRTGKERRCVWRYLLPACMTITGRGIWQQVVSSCEVDADQFSSVGLGSVVEFIRTDLIQRQNWDYNISIFRAFCHNVLKEVCVMGFTCAELVGAVFVLLLLLWAILRKRHHGGILAVGTLFVPAYMTFLLYIYLRNMSESEALQSASHDRYIGSMVVGLAMLIFTALLTAMTYDVEDGTKRRIYILNYAILAIVSLMYWHQRGAIHFLTTDYGEWRCEEMCIADWMIAETGAEQGSLVDAYFITTDASYGKLRFFQYRYELFPYINIWELGLASSLESGDNAGIWFTPEYTCDGRYMIVDGGFTDEYWDEYGSWFDQATTVEKALYQYDGDKGQYCLIAEY